MSAQSHSHRIKVTIDVSENGRFPLLYEVYKRAKGQLNSHVAAKFSSHLLQEKAEKDLDALLVQTQKQFSAALASHDYDRAYELISELQPALASLFDEVKILADDAKVQENRIALLQRVFSLFSELLDFSKIQIG